MHAYCPSIWEDEAGGFEGNLGYTMRLENQSKLIIFLNEEGRKGGRREKEGRKKRRREGYLFIGAGSFPYCLPFLIKTDQS